MSQPAPYNNDSNSKQSPPQQPPQVPYLQTLAQYQEQVNLLDENTLLVLDFTASWCGPCRKISPIFQQMQLEYQDVCFRKVDVDQAPEITEFFRIEAMPTFVFLRGGDVLARFSGASAQQLRQLVDTHRYPPPPQN